MTIADMGLPDLIATDSDLWFSNEPDLVVLLVLARPSGRGAPRASRGDLGR